MDDRRLPCSECHVLTRTDCLVDGADLAPFVGLVCPECEAALTVAVHDDPGCTCVHCAYAALATAAAGRARDALAHGGLTLVVEDCAPRGRGR